MNSRTGENLLNKNLARVLVQNSPVGIILIQDNKAVYQNAKSVELVDTCLGMSIEHIFQNVFAEDLAKFKIAYERILSKSSDSIEIEFRVHGSNHTKNEPVRWFILSAKAFLHEGRFAVLINLIDNSKNKKNEDLINLIDRMSFFDQIASGVAHEIRNPLTAISSYLYSLEKIIKQELGELEPMQSIKSILNHIDDASHNIEVVIKKLMGTARIGSPKMALMNANESIEEVIEFMSDVFQQNGITIVKSLGEELPNCYADPDMIRQAIMNLVNNSCVALEKNQGSKKLELRSYSEKNMIFISVSDSGPGVSEKIQERLSAPLSPFAFVETGVGLRVVQKIVALHSGFIQATDSKLGGLAFNIGLPINKRALPRK